MITNSTFNLFVRGARILLVAFVFSFICSCRTAPQKAEKKSIVEHIPRKVAVLPARFAEKNKKSDQFFDPEFEKEHFVADLVRGVIHNQLPGRGYLTRPLSRVERLLKSSSTGKAWHAIPPEELCKLLGVDGIVYPGILSFSMKSAGTFNFYKITAQVKIVNSSGKDLGTWNESAVTRQVLFPTDYPDAEPTLLELVMDESVKRHMRLTVYDWGWKIVQTLPKRPQGIGLPDVLSVETNIDKGTFRTGEQITAAVEAEGELSCMFDITGFKQNIPMPVTDRGNYSGAYIVREGDRASAGQITIHLMTADGMTRSWIEPAGTVTIE